MHLSRVKAAMRRKQCRQQWLESSMIRQVRYIDDQQVLVVQFSSGDWYAYADVPKRVWDKLVAAESAGQFFHTHVRDRYDYRHMSLTPRELNSELTTGPEVRR